MEKWEKMINKMITARKDELIMLIRFKEVMKAVIDSAPKGENNPRKGD